MKKIIISKFTKRKEFSTSIKQKNKEIDLTYTLFLSILISMIIFVTPLTAVKQITETVKNPMSFKDIMKFRSISKDTVISKKGDWVLYSAKSDIGNGTGFAYHIPSGKTYEIPRGSNPAITKNSAWIAMSIKPDALEKAKEDKNKKLKTGMALFETASGKIIKTEKVKTYLFSNDSKWLVYESFPEDKKTTKQKDIEKKNLDIMKKDIKKKKDKIKTFPLALKNLTDGKETIIKNVSSYSLDPASRFIVLYIYIDALKKEGSYFKKSGLYSINLNKSMDKIILHNTQNFQYFMLNWSKKKSRLAFIVQEKMKKKVQNLTSALFVWDGIKNKTRTIVSQETMPDKWMLPIKNQLKWSDNEDRLFFGFKPIDEYKFTNPEMIKKEDKSKLTNESLFDLSRIKENKGVDVWHWQDPLINSNQKKMWEKLKKRLFTAVYFFKKNRFIKLADRDLTSIITTENPHFALGRDNSNYRREITWDGRYSDIFIINMKTGTKKKLLSHFNGITFLSNQGKFVLYYNEKHWHLYNIEQNHTLNLTKNIKTPFYNEDHDYPSRVPSYRFAGWTKNDKSVIIYDKYDIWQFFTSGKAICLTDGEGRKHKITYRIKKLDKEAKYFKWKEKLLLTGFSHKKKYQKFYSASIGNSVLKPLIKKQENKWFKFLAKAKNKNRILYTRENFQEFPDLWISNTEFNSPRKISDVNPQKQNFLWGKGEIVEWTSLDGTHLQGALFKPENYDKNKRYPVLVYYYRFMSQLVHRFNHVVINHRPCFPYYTGHDYIVFLPDIRFDIGRPGYSTLKCLVPGVQKLISMGIADPKAIGIHGHSWSGYQTAHVITMTNIFACAIAGAPVTNMTSAYNGIRWKSGLARQFQYEKSQSRIGSSLIEAPHLYIENSPVFFADRIQTPLLIQFGDKDGAVPWYQGIELYLTMRRLNKNCIFLQYNDEPHHLKQYSNKLDYTIKFKEYMDHYLKEKPAPEWMAKGVPYRKNSYFK